MRAVVFEDAASPVRVVEVELAPPGQQEVRVAIAAAGVCHSDLHVRRGDWELQLPLVMGHEGSGTILEIGSQVDGLVVGDHVVLSWVAPCGKCRYCRAGREARCEVAANVVALGGGLHDGTSRLSVGGRKLHHYLGVSSFAEEAVVPAAGAIKIRKDAPLDVMCLVGCAVATGIGAVRNTAEVTAGSTVAVIGCGGVGLSVVQGAMLAGAARIVAVDVRADKLDLARKLGATDVIDAGAVDPVETLYDLIAYGVDYCFDAIGKTTTTQQSIRMLGLGGAAVIVGIPPAGATASFEPQLLVDRDQRILGSNYGGVRPAIDIPRIVDEYLNGDVMIDELISARRGLEDADEALEDLAGGATLRQLLIP